MLRKNWLTWCLFLGLTAVIKAASDDDYNTVNQDGSFQFGYDTPDSYHHAAGNRNNVVRGEFGGRNPGTGTIDSTLYTAGPRGFRPVGKNIHRKYDLNQNGPRPVGSPDDPYFDPYEDPSYNFAFRTRTYNRQENANRFGDVSGKYNYIDDVGEVHNVEFVAGKNTGFHVKTPFPDSNPRAYYGRLFFRGRGKPIPRGRTSIQRGLDGSYKFVSAGPDQRRTETSDNTGHVRGSYTYLDDKGVQHSVHYIAGPETGYRVLKNVKGPHLPTVYPFERPEIIPPDFYDDGKLDLFDTAASGHFKPTKPINNNNNNSNSVGTSGSKPDDSSLDNNFNSNDQNKPTFGENNNKPDLERPPPSETDFGNDSDFGDFEGDLFGPTNGRPQNRPPRPPPSVSRPPSIFSPKPDDGSYKPDPIADNGSYIPPGDKNQDDGSYKPGLDEAGLDFDTFKPRPDTLPKPGLGSDSNQPPGGTPSFNDYDDTNGLFGSESNSRPPYNFGGSNSGAESGSKPSNSNDPNSKPGLRPPYSNAGDEINLKPPYGIDGTGLNPPYGTGTGTKPPFNIEDNQRPILEFKPACENCQGTIVTNLGDRHFSVPPGVSVRAHVQSIDLLPLASKIPSPSEQYNHEMDIKTEQLNSAASQNLLTNTTATEEEKPTVATTTTATTETVTTTTAEIPTTILPFLEETTTIKE